jgi:type II secretory pathway component PulC
MKENIPPEEKLLRLIRGPRKQASTVERPATETPQDSKRCVNHAPALPLKIYFSKLNNTPNLRKAIFFLFASTVIYLLACLIYPFAGLKKIKLPEIEQETAVRTQEETREAAKSFEYYQSVMGNRNIFSQSLGQDNLPASGINIDITKDINLVGIITGENPQAVIEDKKTQKTYYVTKGQFIGEIQIEDIKEGKIIISYRGQRFELYL